MNVEAIKEFQSAVANTDWTIGFNEFAERLGKKPNISDVWQAEMWQRWKAIATALKQIDAETLAIILR